MFYSSIALLHSSATSLGSLIGGGFAPGGRGGGLALFRPYSYYGGPLGAFEPGGGGGGGGVPFGSCVAC